ncbi:hypothetical protein H5410_002467, partial [Solanum commersonii]
MFAKATFGRFCHIRSQFLQRLEVTGWICFALEPCNPNEQMVRELYANLMVTKLANPLMNIREKIVNFGPEAINEIYGLQNHGFENKNVPWANTKSEIISTEFIAELRNWISNVCSWVSPCGNTSCIPVLRAQIVACILDDIPLNVGNLI